jgi:hypothetical protein
MTEDDLLIELPGTAWINNYPFVLLETDKVLALSFLSFTCIPCTSLNTHKRARTHTHAYTHIHTHTYISVLPAFFARLV